ncbi:hypothetical protein GGX14DRAFT_699601 [Mycena pura]|uniref:DUF6534 domain-containing protein n=1 Tax=Mycena pura TaxID=153505 RepID=A0AAD6V4U6_9AGAR|nr:hypothetical protein GGX14DRAFT_699601 [Mycena pura]
MSATLQPGAALDNTMGSMLLGVIVSAVLYGISLLQCLFYFTRYGRDPLYLKALVISTVFLDTVHLSFVIHTVYHYLITNYYNHDALGVMIWSVSLEALPTGVTAALVQSFYAHRVYKMSHQNVLLTGLILLIVLATSACGTAWVVLALEAQTYERLLHISPLTISINALSTSADVIITVTMCFMLYQTRPASLETESMCLQLILSPKTLIYASFYFCIGRLYSNALLASLNARSVIRGRINDVDSNFHIKTSLSGGKPMSRDIFAHQTSDGVSSDTTIELAVHVERETYIDKEYNGSVKFAQSQHESLTKVAAAF